MNRVNPSPIRELTALPTGCAGSVVTTFADASLPVLGVLLTVVLGRRRLGFCAGPAFGFDEVFGRVVRNAPRTSSSSCANTAVEPETIVTDNNNALKIALIFIATSPSHFPLFMLNTHAKNHGRAGVARSGYFDGD